jgi:hypothetical protein
MELVKYLFQKDKKINVSHQKSVDSAARNNIV